MQSHAYIMVAVLREKQDVRKRGFGDLEHSISASEKLTTLGSTQERAAQYARFQDLKDELHDESVSAP